ncbi:MAG: MATE family efflux transporter [Oscillospiraceae bacterium]|jgi:putative MATE family efflux protein|nr:MATE family efflux transporter [Oscillospiraceae bacterium]
MHRSNDFTQGDIFLPLLRFSLPILAALILQTAYGAVDLWMVGRFATAADVSAVSTGSQLMHTITCVVTGLTMGTTVMLGQTLGQGKGEEAGSIIGSSIALFSLIAALLTAFTILGAEWLARITQVPEEAISPSLSYIRMCGAGLCFITAYNVFGSIFRGMGDSKTPLMTVAIACAVNVAGDYLLVAVLGLGALGAAIATVCAQGVSVAVSLLVVSRRGLGFPFSPRDIRFHRVKVGRILRLGTPVALQDGLVSISFLVILSIVNSLGLVASAGVGVAEKLCGFIMLVPSAFSQSVTTFVAQNVGAGRLDRARKCLGQGILASLCFGVVIGYLSFFHGSVLAGLFNGDPAIVSAAADYLRAYAIDVLMTSFLFPFIGYFNGRGSTGFVMVQGLVGAFCIRIPVSFFMSRLLPVSLFRVGLATPCSSLAQILLCGGYFLWLRSKDKKAPAGQA